MSILSLCVYYDLLGFSRYRTIIFSYLRSPETKMGVINILIWLDQVNGIFLGLSLIAKAVLNIYPFPVNEVFGTRFCEWFDLPVCMYLVGSFLWSSITAMYRIMYIKGSKYFDVKKNEKKLLIICLTFGFSLHVPLSLWLTKFDYWSSFEKLCTHQSNEEIDIRLAYQDQVST